VGYPPRFLVPDGLLQAARVDNTKADAALLDDLINNIQFMPGDALRNVNDSVKLIAETAPDANNLLRQYVAFASQRAASHLNEELKGAWAARTIQMKAQVKRQEEVAKRFSPAAYTILSRR
jgi:lipopolysaccharide biosynthesis protein WzzE